MSIWAVVVVASLGCYGLKLAGVSLPGSVLNHPGVQRVASLLPVAMLTALVVTGLFGAGGRYSADWPAPAAVWLQLSWPASSMAISGSPEHRRLVPADR